MPAASIMRLYFHNHFDQAKPARGAPPTTLPTLLHRDLVLVGRKLREAANYKALRSLVVESDRNKDRDEWQEMVEDIAKLTSKKVLEQTDQRKSGRKRTPSVKVRDRTEERDPPIEEKPTCIGSATANWPQSGGDSRGQDQDITAMIARPPRTAKRRRPNLTVIPDERPAARQRTLMREECDTAASIVRNQRLDERLNVNNGVISGRTF